MWFLIFPDSEILDLAGPWSALGYANEVVGWPAYQLRLATPSDGVVRTRHGLVIAQADPLQSIEHDGQPHTLIAAGGTPSSDLPPAEAAAAAWLSGNAGRFQRVASVCTGAFVLGAAGLLDHRKATTHWHYRDALRQAFPLADVTDDDIFLKHDTVWTSAGITSGIDLMLAMIEEDLGHEVAITVAKGLVLFLRRSGRQAQFSHVLQRQQDEPSSAGEIRALIGRHLSEMLTVERVAELAGMSPRSFSRFCARVFGESPAALVRRLRVEEAQRLLEQTELPLKNVALRSGLGDPATLWRAFVQQFGVSPAAYRARFL
jgi:transcriptional regulator GlxA family with amidase domain